MQGKMPVAQRGAWILAAVAGPILSIAGRNGWLTVLLAALVCTVLCLSVFSCRRINLPQWLSVIELVWLTVFLGAVAGNSATCWTGTNAFPAIPIILLGVSAFASRKGAICAARIGTTLLWIVIPVLGIVFLAGTADMNPNWIKTDIQIPDGTLIGLLLLPCLQIFVSGESNKSPRWIPFVIGAVSVAASVVLDAVIGPEDAAEAANNFYELSKSVDLFGVAERFEALIACVLTASWFTLFTMILSTAHELTVKIVPTAAKWSVWVIAALSAVLMCILPKQVQWIGVGCLIFWGFLPALTQGIGVRKNIEKK